VQQPRRPDQQGEQQAGKQLTQDQATTIVRMASQIQAVIGC
jgi:hypothetical protein